MEELSGRISLIRNLSIVVTVFSIMQLVFAVTLPDVLTTLIKTWLISVVGCVFFGLIITLFLARHDLAIILFINFISPYVSGVITGISLTIIILKIKN